MRLSGRFVILGMSIAASPIVAALLIGTIQNVVRFADGPALSAYANYRQAIDRAVSNLDPESPDWNAFTDSLPNDRAMVVLNSRGRVVAASDVSPVSLGAQPTLGELWAASTEAENNEIVVLPVRETAYRVIAMDRSSRAFVGQARWFLVAFVVMIPALPISLSSLWILTHLRKSMKTLHGAAIRIASGDTATAIDTSGTDEFADVRRAFETMRQTIRNEYARRARFTLGVSHDLKTPLSLIQGYAEAIDDGFAEDPETLRRYVGIIRERSELLEERIQHLIAFLRLETGEWHSTLQPVRLAAFLEDLAHPLSADLKLSGNSLTSILDLPEEQMVILDPVMVRRAIENLVHNAIRYSPPASRVRLTAEVVEFADGRYTEITVANPVPGGGAPVHSAQLATLSEPFYRGDQSRARSGSGLGLAVVKSVVESHDWMLVANDEDESETRIVIRIPMEPPTNILL